jgi:type II secretory pathway pseudopilin PulG
MKNHKAATLIEVVVVIAILGVLVGFLLPAVLKVRIAALRIQSMNKLKQCCLAIHSFADTHGGKCPTLSGSERGCPNPEDSFFFALLPYLEEDNYYAAIKAGTQLNSSAHTVNAFISPADPTLMGYPDADNCASYAANAVAFDRRSSVSASFSDGTSHTIALAEHYAFKFGGTQFSWWTRETIVFPTGSVMHRASFAEYRASPPGPFGVTAPPDVFPVTKGNPPSSSGSVAGLTFQAAPSVNDYDPRLAQTPHRSGMLVAMVDGSVHSLNAMIAPRVYWALVTPDSGEAVDLP